MQNRILFVRGPLESLAGQRVPSDVRKSQRVTLSFDSKYKILKLSIHEVMFSHVIRFHGHHLDLLFEEYGSMLNFRYCEKFRYIPIYN